MGEEELRVIKTDKDTSKVVAVLLLNQQLLGYLNEHEWAGLKDLTLQYNISHPQSPITETGMLDLMSTLEHAKLVSHRYTVIGSVAIMQYKLSDAFGSKAHEIVKPFVKNVSERVMSGLLFEPVKREK
ncbi:MAG: hypothetical protein KGH57_01900 [Candidatus Micrarchaeota archaeon]|nr:hypothetical protein [Candidatus Micrarchaeota archaeon]